MHPMKIYYYVKNKLSYYCIIIGLFVQSLFLYPLTILMPLCFVFLLLVLLLFITKLSNILMAVDFSDISTVADCVTSLMAVDFSEISTVADCLTFFSVVVALMTLFQTKSLKEADFIEKYNEKYQQNDMRFSLEVLGEIEKRLSKENKEMLRMPINNKNKQIKLIQKEEFENAFSYANEARRNVKLYFLNILDLYLHNKISVSTLRIICNKSGLLLLFSVVEPMEKILNDRYDYKKFYILMIMLHDIWEEKRKQAGFSNTPAKKYKCH